MSPGRRLLVVLVSAALAVGCASVWSLGVPRGTPISRGMWVWSSDRILGSASEQRALFDFSDDHGIGALWVQVTTQTVGGRGTPGLALEVSRAAEWRALLAAAHDRGFTVEALDGDPTYADAAFHYVPLAITDAVIDFNRAGPPAARFDGLRFDNEPYLLPGWSDAAVRAELLRDYAALTDAIARRVAPARPLTFGVDLPFWWDAESSAHVLSRVDSVTIMDYRNEASGPDGLVALATPILAAADRAGHALVRVGVETRVFEETRAWFVAGPPVTAVRDTLGRSWRARYPGEPFRLRSLEDGGRIHLGMSFPGDTAGPPPPDLVAIARDYGTPATAENRVGRLSDNPDWTGVEPHSIFDSQKGTRYNGFIATNVPQAKLTFATRQDDFAGETSVADRAFRQFSIYRGLAIHDYEGFRAIAPGQ